MSPRPAGGYKLASGERVPGNTTIVSQLGWNTRPLMYWANKMGLEGKPLAEAQELEATVGTFIHAIIEAELRGKPRPELAISQEQKDRVDNALLGFYEWRDSSLLKVTHIEIPLISEIHRYGTTPDFPALVRQRRRMIQLKTADGLYPEVLIQVAAEGAAWDENFPDDPVDGYDILRIGKGDGSFHHDYFPRGAPKMVAALKCFLHLRALYDLAKAMK